MTRTVAVGVGGTGGWQALSWAVDEAAATNAHLAAYRICRPDSPLADTGTSFSLAQLELADPSLARAMAATRTRLGGQRVTLSLRTGEPGQELVRAAAGAGVMVIGAPDEAIQVHGTVNRVTEHAPCPVVAVRPVRHGRTSLFAGHLVLGVDGSAGGQAALEFGFAYADRHGLPVAAVHVSAQRHEDYWYDDTTLSTDIPAEPADLKLLATEVEPWHHKFPHIPVKRAVLAGPTADGLLRAGVSARLLVIGNQRRGRIGRRISGNITRAVLDRASGSVAVMHVDDGEGGTR